MSKKFLTILLAFALAVALIIAGCSEEDTTPTGGSDGDGGGDGTPADTTTLNFVDVTAVIKNVAPPVYSAPVAKMAADSFEIWTQGEYPLLEKVFGNEDPQTLYRNLDDFEMFMEIITEMILVDENGDVITGTFTESVTDTIMDSVVTLNCTVTISELTSATVIPTAVQNVIGTSYDLDYLVETSVAEFPTGEVDFAFKIDSTSQTIVSYQKDMSGEPGATESQVVYSTLDPRDSSFVFKGAMHNVDSEGTFCVAYIMTSEVGGGFSYRMSWYGTDPLDPEYSILACIIGGGNKDIEFAMKYRHYIPADATDNDPEWSFDEVFGPDYTNGTGLITDYADYVNEALIIGYSDIPLTAIPNPWNQ